jgi:1A family penicillin-binding protein
MPHLPKALKFIFKWVGRLIGVVFALFLLGVAGLGLLYIYFTRDLPQPENFAEKNLIQSTKIYDRTGTALLYEIYGEERRSWVPLSTMPENLKQMAVATEDAQFYTHYGIDLKGIIRSAIYDLETGGKGYGGSTITQQLIRSTFLTNEKTVERKFREIVLSIELERNYSKDQILEWYLNQVPFGENAYGVEAASSTLFGKPITDISAGEAATLIALIQAPSRYLAHQDELTQRKNYVIDRMVEEHYFTKDQADKAKADKIAIAANKDNIKAPYFTLWIKQLLDQQYGDQYLQENGLSVYTSLDWGIQQTAETIVAAGVKKNYAYNAHNGAMVVSDPKTGQILAMTVGSGNYYDSSYPPKCKSGIDCQFDPQYNVPVADPGRQPGSSFKPFVYATAFEKGYDDTTVVVDEPTCFGIWGGKEYCPQNFDLRFHGPVTLRQALAGSLNVPSVKVLNSLAGLKDSITKAQEMGITTLNNPSTFYGLSLVLGGGEVKLLDMVNAYGTFATGGLSIPPQPILKIVDSKGNEIFTANKQLRRTLEPKSAYTISSILSDNNARAFIFGTHSQLYFPDRAVAVKTGTTSDYRDGWIIGYTPSIVAGVWVGNNNNEPMSQEPGSVVAAPILHNFFDKVLPGYPKETFPNPKSAN